MENTPELTYNSEATIVYNASDSTWASAEPKIATADLVTVTMRNAKRLRSNMDRYEQNREKVREYLIENYSELGEHADEIAKLLEMELSQEIEFSMDVTITGTITIPVDVLFEDLSEYDFEVELTCNNSDYDLSVYDATIDRISSQVSQQVGKVWRR